MSFELLYKISLDPNGKHFTSIFLERRGPMFDKMCLDPHGLLSDKIHLDRRGSVFSGSSVDHVSRWHSL